MRQISQSNSDYLEPIPDGARSPGEGSEASHFTSVSQRGINPNWMPPPGMGRGGMSQVSSASAVQRRKEDVILNANPDFSLPVCLVREGEEAEVGEVGLDLLQWLDEVRWLVLWD